MKKIAALIAAVALASQAHATSIALGTQELQLNGGIDFDSVSGTAISLDVGYGYFIADYLEVGGLLGFSDDDFVTSISAGGFVEYNIETETTAVPFIGSSLRIVDVDLDTGLVEEGETAGALGLYAGVKFFVTEDMAVSVRALAETATEDIYVEDDGQVENVDFRIDFGLRYFY